MPEIRLEGCTPEPLMNYLKALGVFRLVAEQVDPEAQLSWQGGTAHLRSILDEHELARFITMDYSPTPVMTPWNSASGFAPTKEGNKAPKDKAARAAIAYLSGAASSRLSEYSNAIQILDRLSRGDDSSKQWKQDYFLQCRSTLPDSVVVWLDTCFAISAASFLPSPLLGTGGNDGVTDFASLFMQHICKLIADPPVGHGITASTEWIVRSLFARGFHAMDEDTVGQFNPGGIGGPNGTQGRFEARSRLNPWDYVLAIEGALLFAGAVARRWGAISDGRAVFPFSVESVAVGYGSATSTEETTDGSRAELWLPLWDEWGTLPEVRHLFAEGRAQIGRKQARNAVEFGLAVNLLGVSRGVKSFVRNAFLKRNGLAFLATPLGRIDVQSRPNARLLADPPLVEWIDRLRHACRDKDKTPSRYQAALRNLDRAMFTFVHRSEQGNDKKYLLEVLTALGRAERTLAGGLTFCRGKHLRPLQGLSPQWWTQADDDTPEFRLAASLAGIRPTQDKKVGPFRAFLEEVEVTKFVNWSPGSTSAVWSRRSLAANLAAVFQRRQLEAYRLGQSCVPLDSRRHAFLPDVLLFLEHGTDDEKLEDLLWGFVGLEYPRHDEHSAPGDVAVPLEFGLPRLLVEERCFVAQGQGRRWSLAGGVGHAEPNAKPDPTVFHFLASGQRDAVAQSVDRAARRLRSFGLVPNGHRNRQSAGRSLAVISPTQPERLLASMLFPLSDRDLEQLANIVLYSPEKQE